MIVSRRSPFEPLPADALEQAKEHLQRSFAFVGVTEQLEEFIALLTVALGWPTRLPMRVRASQSRLGRTEVAPDTLRIIERSNELDAELHAFARGLLGRALEQAGPEVRLELDIARRAAEWTDGGARVEPPPDDLRAKLVDARADSLSATRESSGSSASSPARSASFERLNGANETGA
jgi:hypothetical protein